MIFGSGAELTPVEQRGGLWLKRDDLYRFAGRCGGKVRTCRALAAPAAVGLVTAGSRSSPQVEIVASVAAELGLRCRCQSGRPALNRAAAGGASAAVLHTQARCRR